MAFTTRPAGLPIHDDVSEKLGSLAHAWKEPPVVQFADAAQDHFLGFGRTRVVRFPANTRPRSSPAGRLAAWPPTATLIRGCRRKACGTSPPPDWPTLRQRQGSRRRSRHRRRVGVLPWNFPLLLAAWKVAPAFAAGCAIVLKPSEVTSLSALWLGQIATEAGLPDGVLNVVPGYGDPAGQALDQPLGVDKSALGLILEPLLGMFNPAPSAGAPPTRPTRIACRDLNAAEWDHLMLGYGRYTDSSNTAYSQSQCRAGRQPGTGRCMKQSVSDVACHQHRGSDDQPGPEDPARETD